MVKENEKFWMHNDFVFAYENVTSRVAKLKSAFMGICSNIDRHIRQSLQIDIRKKLAEDDAIKIKKILPLLDGLSLEQLERLILIFHAIRNNNAHLSKCSPIFIDDDLLEYFNKILKPEKDVFKISKTTGKKMLTLYGGFYILVFLSQRYMLNNFIDLFYKDTLFNDLRDKNRGELLTQAKHLYMNYCGNERLISNDEVINNIGWLNAKEILFINDSNRNLLTKLFFDFESVFYDKSFRNKVIPFRNILKKFSNNDQNINKIVELRNLWFHGYHLYDNVEENGQNFVFDLNYLLDVLNQINILFEGNDEYRIICADIKNYAQTILNYFILRIVELSFKLLDVDLLKEEKINERINGTIKSLNKIMAADKNVIEKAKQILSNAVLKWHIHPFKFEDQKERRLKSERVEILKFHSDNGFDIGKYHSDLTDMALVIVDLPLERQNKINGQYIYSYEKTNTQTIANTIILSDAKKPKLP